MVTVTPLNCKKALNKLNCEYLPYKYDLNIYRGCEHACMYCFALYSHKYLESSDFFGQIYVKTNILERLEKELKSKSWKRDIINIGGVTDSYQPIEKDYELMPKIIELMIKYKTPVIISTKSDLILRDFDLLKELSEHVYVNVASTIITMNEDLSKIIEPGAKSPEKRIKMLKKFKSTNVNTGIHTMPIIPTLTDSKNDLEEIFKASKDAEVDYIITGILNLKGSTREVFFKFLSENYPEKLKKVQEIYKSAFADEVYSSNLYEMLYILRKKYDLVNDFKEPIAKRTIPKQKQLKLTEF